MPSTPIPPDLAGLLDQALARARAPQRTPPERLLLVDVARQRLFLLERGVPVADWPVSTAARGVGGEQGSFRTPAGWHRIRARIGEGAALGTVFESREPRSEARLPPPDP